MTRSSKGQDTDDRLKAWRKQIDDINHQIKKLLLKRWRLAGRIAKYKTEQKVPLRDAQREATMMISLLRDKNLDEAQCIALATIFRTILNETRKEQKRRVKK